MDKTFDPQHLDIRLFAQTGTDLRGESPLGHWSRLLDEQFAENKGGMVRWHLQGYMVPVTGGAPRVAMHLKAEVDLALQCQRCLSAVVQKVEATRDFLFVADEATAETLDEDSEADVLVISRDFDALSLVEDELILALPLVPRHEACPQSLPDAAVDEAFEQASERPHPFAALAALKKGN